MMPLVGSTPTRRPRRQRPSTKSTPSVRRIVLEPSRHSSPMVRLLVVFVLLFAFLILSNLLGLYFHRQQNQRRIRPTEDVQNGPLESTIHNVNDLLNALDFDQPIICGAHKCLFPQKNLNSTTTVNQQSHNLTTTTDNMNVAYLIVQDGPERTRAMVRAWELAKFLSSAFAHSDVVNETLQPDEDLGSTTATNNLNHHPVLRTLGFLHLELEPPQEVWFSQSQAQILDTANLYYAEAHKQVRGRMFRQGTMTIQKVQLAPHPHLLFGTTSEKKNLLWDNLDTFIHQHVMKTTTNDHETNNTSQQKQGASDFARHFINNLHTCQNQLVDKIRCLAYDFQVFVDVHGNFYHLDLDRCFLRSPEEEWEFVERLQRRFRQVEKELTKYLI